ncbi:MAG: PTS sugar transporter subunit IIA [Bacteroidetes bacterium]|nr:PTS sugar transporter subunit IIA [Bacteroidota bacterium]
MKISDFLSGGKIIAELKGNTKEDIINELINLYADDEKIVDIEKVRKAVVDREKIMSTGVGKGFAIPHAKTNDVNDIIAAFGKLKEPVNFDSLDKEPVNLVMLLVAKENQVGIHIKLLSRISRMINNEDFREALINAETESEILSVFEEEEKKYI